MTVKKPSKVPKLTLAQAENRLFDPHLGFKVDLRKPYEYPPGVVSEDIHLHISLALERDIGNPRRKELAEMVYAKLEQKMKPTYSAPSVKESKLVLKLYVVDISEGDRRSRIIASGFISGNVRLCLAWIICSPDGAVVFDGGRVGEVDSLGYGVLDILRVSDGETCLRNTLAPMLIDQIMEKIDIKSGKPWHYPITNNIANPGACLRPQLDVATDSDTESEN